MRRSGRVWKDFWPMGNHRGQNSSACVKKSRSFRFQLDLCMRSEHYLLPLFALLVFACGDRANTAAEADVEPVDTLAAGDEPSYDMLFNGQDLSGWHKYGGGPVGSAWKVDNGSLYLDVSNKNDQGVVGGGDIVTDESYEDYELILEWKIAECGNSGIIYNVIEEPDLAYPWMSGPEMQVLDNSCHPDAKIYTHKAGDLYDMISGDSTAVKPAGEWNEARLVVTDGKVEHWLNGVKMVEYANSGDSWKAMIAKSKFKDMPRFGSATGGKIALQDHGDGVWYRNIRVREL